MHASSCSSIPKSDPAAVVADLERRARRFETPCGGGSLVWRAWGKGPPLLLAHGSHGSWLHWIRNIDALAERYTVWALDLPGYGDSAMPEPAEHPTIAQIIASGLNRLIAPILPIDIIGFSFGGVVAAHLASFYPDLVRRLILVDTGGLNTPMGKVELTRMRGLDEAARDAANRSNLLALMLHHPASVDALALHVQATCALRGRLDPVPLVLPDKLLKVLPHVRAPLSVIWGEHDRPHPDPATQERALRQHHPSLQFRVICGAGHWVMYEQPEAFNDTVFELLDAAQHK